MPDVKPGILSYSAHSERAQPRYWIPAAMLGIALLVWDSPRLTPTFFPTTLDWMVLVLFIPVTILMARYSSLPGWAFTTFGGLGVCLFLVANLDDNNFRANFYLDDILLPWCLMVAGGAIGARMIAAVVRFVSRGRM